MENENVIITLPKSLWEKIVSGEKKIEVRKKAPKDEFDVTKIYVIIKGTDVVAGYFTLNDLIICDSVWWFFKMYEKQICVPFEWLLKYAGKPYRKLYGWRVGKVKTFENGVLFRSDFGLKSNPQSFVYTEKDY